MRSGDRPGLQNRRVAGNPVTGGFDPHSLPPKQRGYRSSVPFPVPLSAKPRNFAVALRTCSSVIDITVHVHRGADVSVPHELLLHG